MRKKCVALLMLLVLFAGGCGPRHMKFSREFDGLFDTVTVVIGYAQSEREFNRFSEIIYTRMEELHRLYDIYNSYDGINNLKTVNENAGIAPVEVSGDIIGLLLLARESYDLSKGTVNAALGAVLRIWHDYRAEGAANPAAASLPPDAVLREAADSADIGDLIIDEANGTVFLRKAGMSLDVGAIAKGYAAGLAVRAAEEAGMRSVLLNAGGNITAGGKPLDGARDRWSIGVQAPVPSPDGVQELADTIFFNGMTVSCSGGYQRFYTVGGVTYSHIIDPATLMPAVRYKQVTVVHKDSGMADMLATALFILPYDEGVLLSAECGAEALWIDIDGHWRATEGYAGMSKTLGGRSAVD